MNPTQSLPIAFAPSDESSWTKPIAKIAARRLAEESPSHCSRRGTKAIRVLRLTKSLSGTSASRVLLPERFAGRRFRLHNHGSDPLLP